MVALDMSGDWTNATALLLTLRLRRTGGGVRVAVLDNPGHPLN